MVWVIAFDRDMTVETSNGPVSLALIKRLKERGNICLAIGNQALVKEAEIPSGMLCDHEPYDKTHALMRIRTLYPGYERYIVVDDIQINVAGWEYFTPAQFSSTFS